MLCTKCMVPPSRTSPQPTALTRRYVGWEGWRREGGPRASPKGKREKEKGRGGGGEEPESAMVSEAGLHPTLVRGFARYVPPGLRERTGLRIRYGTEGIFFPIFYFFIFLLSWAGLRPSSAAAGGDVTGLQRATGKGEGGLPGVRPGRRRGSSSAPLFAGLPGMLPLQPRSAAGPLGLSWGRACAAW